MFSGLGKGRDLFLIANKIGIAHSDLEKALDYDFGKTNAGDINERYEDMCPGSSLEEFFLTELNKVLLSDQQTKICLVVANTDHADLTARLINAVNDIKTVLEARATFEDDNDDANFTKLIILKWISVANLPADLSEILKIAFKNGDRDCMRLAALKTIAVYDNLKLLKD